MPLQSEAEAVAQARRQLGLPDAGAGTAWRVRLLAAPGAYFLVHVEDRVACLDAVSGALMASASSARAPVALAREAALTGAALGPDAVAELVWQPCGATMSMFDPLWRVAAHDEAVFVDQRGRRWPGLPASRPG